MASVGEDADEALEALDWAAFRAAFELSPTLVTAFTGPELRLAYQNPASASRVGRRPLGIPAHEAFPEYPDWTVVLRRVLGTGEGIRMDAAPMVVRDGERPRALRLDASHSALRDPAGRVFGVLVQAVDVTAAHFSDESVRQTLALSQVSAELSASLDPDEVARTVTRLASEVLGGWAVLDLWQPDGTLARIAGTHSDPSMQPVLDELLGFPRISNRPRSVRSIAATVALTGELAIGWLDPDLAGSASSDEHAALLHSLRATHYLVVPVAMGTRRLGALSLLRSDGSPLFGPGDREVGCELAERAAIALAHAVDYDEQRQAVLLLQRSLLGDEPAAVGDAAIASRYCAGSRGAEVGGDWYDAFPLEGGIGVVVGDVQGHDLSAAVLMSQIRSVVHTHAREGLPPSQVIEQANRFLLETGSERLVTLAYLQLFPAERLVAWVRAGHMPAIVTSPEGTEVITGRGGLPIGVDPAARWAEETIHLPADALLAVFTDGLVESVGRGLESGIAELVPLLSAALPEGDLEVAADRVLDRMVGDGSHADDVALVLLRLRSELPGRRRVVRRLPAAARSAPIARRFVTDLLPQWDADEDTVELAALLVTELVTNATRHSDGHVELRVSFQDRLRVAVFDDSHRLPTLRRPGEWEPNGRGLQLVEALAARWGVEPEEGGKTVWFEL